ncbi:hypothetical protein RvY_12795 [Ramazzottius varieornatus]|uniref:Uncharacterized protein n=1 Tax=Ramazzottius varieornatus TaxID=947166 RepID=A0A1D1VKR0_RAMVA|nr:hypothetical protein RvY_12795 [Ramazzottius varieornatus]
MILFLGLSEIVVGLPVLIAAIMANCTPTTIALASWVVFHGLIGTLSSLIFYVIYTPSQRTKRIFRIAYFVTFIIGIGLGIASAVHGGVGSRIGWYQDSHGFMQKYYNYDYDIFFGVFLGVFEILLLAAGIWLMFEDKNKVKRVRDLINTPRESFATLAAYQATLNVLESGLKKSHSGFFNKKEDEEDNVSHRNGNIIDEGEGAKKGSSGNSKSNLASSKVTEDFRGKTLKGNKNLLDPMKSNMPLQSHEGLGAITGVKPISAQQPTKTTVDTSR